MYLIIYLSIGIILTLVIIAYNRFNKYLDKQNNLINDWNNKIINSKDDIRLIFAERIDNLEERILNIEKNYNKK